MPDLGRACVRCGEPFVVGDLKLCRRGLPDRHYVDCPPEARARRAWWASRLSQAKQETEIPIVTPQ